MTRSALQSVFDVTPAHPAPIQRAACPACTTEDRMAIQPKLTLSRPGDSYEQEADRIAERVVSTRPMPLTGPLPVSPLLQRQPAEEDEEEQETLQAKPAGGVRNSGALGHAAAAVASGGRRMTPAERAFFEPRFGRDFSRVRLHDGPRAAEAARNIGARAYTLGSDIAFAAGQYAPDTHTGRRLLAHELTHTVQQASTAGTVHRVVQRDLSIEPTHRADPQRRLSAGQVRRAIRFNTNRYDPDSIRLIQQVVGGDATPQGAMTESIVRAIAILQRDFGLPQNGQVGPRTFALISRLNGASSAPTGPGDCLTRFSVATVNNFQAEYTSNPVVRDILARFIVQARFEPRCRCQDFQYRQYICGTVSRQPPPVAMGGPAVQTPTPMNGAFSRIPGGRLPRCGGAITHEDGDTSAGSGVGPNYGHRTQGQGSNDRYLPNRANGCEYRGYDVVGLRNISLAAFIGHTYRFDLRFRGEIIQQHQGASRQVAERQWRLRRNVTL
ncbi:eCIS core domain-containing protein [Phaeobacter marinintestinus]|uniref:eCIS core domain-containing protein n=1 Tax=Falsiphaeobacter marinintestinus TaxID=1492905 RepID=UPI0011B49706|nr:DUF4157 domain-containing protein [Phaeobacter marinintestinus]